MNPPQLDPSSVASAIIGLFFGAEIAGYLGPYAVIASGGATGACFALARMQTSGRAFAVWFVLSMTIVSVMLTASIAELIHFIFPSVDVRWLLVPVAMFVGGIGQDWSTIGTWVVSRIGRVFEKRAGIDGI
jgi:hypothetical protein